MQEELLKKYTDSLKEGSKAIYGATARSFLDWLGRKPASGDIARWVAYRKKQGYASGSIYHEWKVIRRLYRVNEIQYNPKDNEAPVISEEDTFAPAMDPADIRAMIRTARGLEPTQNNITLDECHCCFLLMSTMWGLRRTEMVSLCPEDIDTKAGKNGMIYVKTSKRGRARWHLVPGDLMPIITAWGFREEFNNFNMSMLFKDLKLAIGFPMKSEVGWHSIRRSLVMGLMAADFDIAAVHKFMRWKRPTGDMVMRYATSRIISRQGEQQELATDDRKSDEAILAKHPFIDFWREK